MQSLPLSDPDREPARLTDRDTETLEARLRSKDPSALMELFNREEKRAFALAYRVVGDTAAAEDAVQEAFAQLWERSAQLKPGGGRIESLLMTIVHRRAIDHVRKLGRTSHTMPDPDLLERIDEHAAEMLERVEDSLSTAALRTELRAAVAALPVEQRTILNHAYFRHHTLKEIAELESLPLGTVKSRLRLAMEKLSKTLQERTDR